MTLKDLIEKLNKIDMDKYGDSDVEKAVPTGEKGFVGESITRVLQTDNILSDGKPLPDSFRKVILL